MSERFICETNILNYKCEYYLVESKCYIESIGNTLRYGIKVISYDVNGIPLDSKTVPDVFGNESKMIKGIEILKKLQVTPITLEDVLIDNIY